MSAHHHDHPGHHHPGHQHHGHDHGAASQGARLLWALVLNVGITVAQVVGGLLSGSLSLLADAVHNASDAASLGVSYAAQRVARRSADRKRTFGYRRAETIGALVNLVALVMISLYLMGHAVERFFQPQEVEGMIMLVVGGIAFVEDLISVLLLYRGAQESLNIRSAFLHLIGDTLATLAVILGGLAIMWYDVYIIDPILTLALSVYILYHSYGALRATIHILMDSAPPNLAFDDVVATMERVDGVLDVHHVHLWQLDERRTAVEAHIVIAEDNLSAFEAIKRSAKAALKAEHGIVHTTLELECDPCVDAHSGVVPQE